MAQTKVTGPGIADDAVTVNKIPDDAITTAKLATDAVEKDTIKNLNVTTEKVNNLAVTNAKIAAATIDVTSKITGVIPVANLGSGTASSSTILYGDQTYKAEPTTDLTPLRQDIITLALKQGVQENMTKHNLPSSAVVTFQADADFDLAGSTDISRNTNKYIESQTTTVGSAVVFPYHTIAAADRAKLYRIQSATETNNTWLTVGAQAAGGAYPAENIDGGSMLTGGGAMHAYFSTAGVTDWSYSYIVDFTNEYTFSDKLRIAKKANWGDAKTWQVQHSTDNATWTNVDFSSSTQVDHGTKSTTSTDGEFVSGNSSGQLVVSETTQLDNVWTSYVTVDGIGDFTARYFRVQVVDTYSAYNNSTGMSDFMPWYKPTTTIVNATGTALGTANVPSSAVTEVSGVLLLKDAYGATTLGTDVKVYFSANAGTNWSEAASYTDSGTFSTGIKQITLGKTTVTSGSDVRWKITFANQLADTKIAYIYGIGTNY